ncbi:probable ubiquitin carboxyl-terminal hydrolase MINDY-4 [Nematolebias whitei]|uniref:probable ubiquitin carboxyl-terminal hydrolase MINDY-4 n=1 Tax=Nematolebias whitei TaxID=451745 RepID=UPI00189A6BC1|nr:probable ubiquitin carboxyl-terminal hydrolase MINDY-4 [Nematolebias whitei]
MVASVEEVSSSLVREYLSRKGLKRTIACMDEEHPRTEASINNRSHLRSILNLDELYRKNKVQNTPLKTLLEIIVKHHIEKLKNEELVGGECPQKVQTFSSPASKPVLISDSKAIEVRPDFVSSKQRSDKNERCLPMPSYMSSLSEKERPSALNPTEDEIYKLDYQNDKLMLASQKDNGSFVQKGTDRNTSIPAVTQKNRTNHIRRGMMAGPVPQESSKNRKRQSGKVEASQTLFRKDVENRQFTVLHSKSCVTDNSSASGAEGKLDLLNTTDINQDESSCGTMEQNVVKTNKVKTRSNSSDLNVSEIRLDDIDDYDGDLRVVSVQRTVSEFHYSGCAIDQHTAAELKTILLGSSLNCFSVEWLNQGFTFSETDDLRYGIVQKKGGPCGVLASIQAFVLKKLLFENTDSSISILQRLRPSSSTRRRCLVLALAEVLWRAGKEKQASVAINLGTSHFTPCGNYRSERVLEKMMYFSLDNIKDLQFVLEQHIEQFETGMLGCILLIVSAVLSRSIERIREDMDVPTTTLIGAHGYCTQELVNLLLCGRAVSNVFDDDMELDSGDGDLTLLKGIKDPCEVGLLSLFEHYNICKVGAYLKNPSFPVWVVCSESHFCVLFGLQRELLTNQEGGLEFDLYYYDGLANQQEEIRLTVSVSKSAKSFQEVDADLIPPLELCIRTR